MHTRQVPTVLLPVILLTAFCTAGCERNSPPVEELRKLSLKELRQLTPNEHATAELLMREVRRSEAQHFSHQLIAQSGSPGPLAVAWAAKAKLLEEKRDHDGAREALREAELLANRSASQRYKAFVLFRTATFRWLDPAADQDQKLQLFLELQDFCEGDESCTESYIRALNGIGAVALDRGAVLSARDYFEKAISVEADADIREVRMLPEINLGMLAWMQGQYPVARTHLENAWRTVEVCEKENWSQTVSWVLASCAVHSNQPREAIRYVERAKLDGDGIDSPPEHALVVLRCLAQAMLGESNEDEIRTTLAETVQQMHKDQRMFPMSVLMQARAELAMASPKRALEALDAAEGHLEEPVNQIEAVTLRAKCLRELGQLDDAIKCYDDLSTVLRNRYIAQSNAERDFMAEASAIINTRFEQRETEMAGTHTILTRSIAGLVLLGLGLLILATLKFRRSKQAHAALEARQQLGQAKNEALIDQLEEKETALQRKHRLEALGELTSGVAHDFNNLLAVILTSNELMLMRQEAKGDELSDENTELIEMSSHAVSVASDLTSQLLAYGRKQRLEPTTIELPTYFSRTESMLRQTISPCSQLAVRFHRHGPFVVDVDESHLTTALINLCSNSRDAVSGREDGRIEIDINCRRVEVAADVPAGEYVEIGVTDNGVGMTESELSRACQPFFTTKPSSAGTGLGLSSVQGFAHQSGGALRIASTPEKRTTVTMLLPRGEARARPSVANSPSVSERASYLVVDDDSRVRDLVSRMLETAGLEVTTATGIEDAQSQLAKKVPDTLLTDVRMTRPKEGIDLARWVRSNFPEVRVVLMSGYYDPIEFDDFTVISKPFSFGELMKTLKLEEAGPLRANLPR